MTDITPPSSKYGTPQRPVDSSSDLPASPTATANTGPHPLSVNVMDLDHDATSESDEPLEGAEPEADELMTEEEDEVFLDAEGDVDGAAEKQYVTQMEEVEKTEKSKGKAKKAKVCTSVERLWLVDVWTEGT